MDYTVDALLTAVRDLATLPPYDEGADARLLRVLNRQQFLYLTSVIESTREEYRTSTVDIPVTSSLVYDIPPRAIAAGLKMIQATDSSGAVWMMNEIRPADLPWFRTQWVSPSRQFYIYRNQIVFYSAPPAGTITVTCSLRLNELIVAASARTISAVGATTFTLSSTIASGSYDFVQPSPHFDLLAMDQAVTVVGTTGTIAAGVPSRVIAGSYLTPATQTPVCQAPFELHDLLALRVAYVTLKAKGDPYAAEIEKEMDGAKANALKLLEPRPQKARSIINYSAPGWNRGRSGGTRGTF